MTKYSFLDDYSEGCHPAILDALSLSNNSQQSAYAEDEYSAKAKSLIQNLVANPDTAVYFVSGGTLANIIIIAACLKSYEAVIAPSSGHIVSREAGAIEATGHKIVTVPAIDGKLTPEGVKGALDSNGLFPHMAKPRLVYISNSTEIGTFYTKAELSALSAICKKNNLLLMLDGARLGAAITAETNDLTILDIAHLTDIFWIGGTKAGALLGEAIVINNRCLSEDFAFHVKQRGALLAKGRVLGIQFQTLFENALFFENAIYANRLAQKIAIAINRLGYALAAKTETNQVFPILPHSVIDKLQTDFDFYIWQVHDDQHSIIRLVTSWATDESQVDKFIDCLNTTKDAA